MYAKVFAQMYDGTLCTKGPWQALVTFQQLLVLADMDGNVDMTAGAIARRTTIPLEIIEQGIVSLLEDDPESRTPVEDGRRIMPLAEGRSWGWRIVNYKHYRGLKREEDRREYHREYWHKRKQNQQQPNTTQQTQPNQPIAEAEAEANADAKALPVVTTATSAKPVGDPPPAAGDTESQAKPKKKERKEPTGTRLPADWVLMKAWGEWALTERPDWTADTVRTEAAVFADYWHGAAGAKGRKVDWEATWRNWVRRSNAGGATRPGAPAAGLNRQEALEQRNRNVADLWANGGTVDEPR